MIKTDYSECYGVIINGTELKSHPVDLGGLGDVKLKLQHM